MHEHCIATIFTLMGFCCCFFAAAHIPLRNIINRSQLGTHKQMALPCLAWLLPLVCMHSLVPLASAGFRSGGGGFRSSGSSTPRVVTGVPVGGTVLGTPVGAAGRPAGAAGAGAAAGGLPSFRYSRPGFRSSSLILPLAAGALAGATLTTLNNNPRCVVLSVM